MKEKLLELTLEDDNISLLVGDEDKVVLTLTDTIRREFVKGNNKPLDILFAVVVHLVAQALTGKFEEDFISNLKETTPQYRENYAKFVECHKHN